MTNTASCEIPRGSVARTARIAALPLAFTGRAVAGRVRRLAGADAAEVSATAMERNAEQLFAVLGRLKGGAMKVGQALSVHDAMIPPPEIAEPYRRALAKLQAAGPAMPAHEVHRVLAEQLGRDWRRRLRSFDDTPAAAASVGQVHQAVWADGREVAVKVQYPGADGALAADLRTLERFSTMFALLVPAVDAGRCGENCASGCSTSSTTGPRPTASAASAPPTPATGRCTCRPSSRRRRR